MIEPGAGILLIAEPFLKDPNFLRTVVLLCDHKEEGSFGFILNKKYPLKLGELVPELHHLDIPVFDGGPVEQNSLHFIHCYPNQIPGGIPILPGIHWGGDFDIMIEQLQLGLIDAGNIRFFVGYSGWGEGQLKDEMEEKTWLTAEANRTILFSLPVQEIWKASVLLLDDKYQQIVNYPIDPQLN